MIFLILLITALLITAGIIIYIVTEGSKGKRIGIVIANILIAIAGVSTSIIVANISQDNTQSDAHEHNSASPIQSNIPQQMAQLVGINAEYVGSGIFVSESIDISQVYVQGSFSDGSEQAITDFDVSPKDGFSVGENTVRVTHGTFQTTFHITVARENFNIYFDAQDGECNVASLIGNYNGIIQSLPTPSRNGYTFSGWYTSLNYLNEVHEGDIIDYIDEFTLYARWEGRAYTVSYHSNCNLNQTVQHTYTFGESAALVANPFRRNHYVFVGWSTDPNANSIQYEDRQLISNIGFGTETINLYAIWEFDSSTILRAKVNDSGTYREYVGNAESFTMFGQSYHNGFTINLGASFNMWGGGTQYVTFAMSNFVDEGDYFNMTIGHIDGSGNGNVYVRVYLDKTTVENYDYEFYVSSQTAPLYNQRIRIKDRTSMIIQVVNTSGNGLRIGFTDLAISNANGL